MVGSNTRSVLGPYTFLLLVGLLSLAITACANVETIRLTKKVFPPKASADDVEAIAHEPTRPHIQLAELQMTDTWMGFDSMQQNILKKAATLGADAVVFSHPESHVEHQVVNEPVYSPWSYYAPYYYGPGYLGYGGYGNGWGYSSLYGPGPMGWGGYGGGYVAVPYDVTIKSLKGMAIRYTSSE